MATGERRYRWLLWPAAGGVLGSASLTALYLGIVTVDEGWTHARQLMREDARFVIPIILGFGIQVGLFIHMRRNLYKLRVAQLAGAARWQGG